MEGLIKFRSLKVLLLFLILIVFQSSIVLSSTQEHKIKGQVTAVAVTIKTITVDHAGKRINIKYDDKTVFEKIDPAKIREIQGQEVEVTYVVVDGINLAKSIRLAIAELPPGVKEISTKELAKLINEAPGTYVLIDSRPAPRYHASFIPTAISIPIKIMEEEGEKTLQNIPKDKLIIFYCGGPT
ncbi:MAG: rhodanese-like domain-containing protein [Caldimicrobium sp.]|nr:rhodanese-like domain-containing protein [Caldimicrobium sp.]MCX7873063.1 rhodanese-like domain-containing protein [Caldimicrobium sp.]MDW8094816.1 rhodanese-like domain-containing protein [Caldimicrobium sp.]